MYRVNVVLFKRYADDDWHKGVCVNAESIYATIIDTRGNVYRSVHSVRDMLDEGLFNYEINNLNHKHPINESKQTIIIQ